MIYFSKGKEWKRTSNDEGETIDMGKHLLTLCGCIEWIMLVLSAHKKTTHMVKYFPPFVTHNIFGPVNMISLKRKSMEENLKWCRENYSICSAFHHGSLVTQKRDNLEHAFASRLVDVVEFTDRSMEKKKVFTTWK